MEKGRLAKKLYISYQVLILTIGGLWLVIGPTIYFHDSYVINQKDTCVKTTLASIIKSDASPDNTGKNKKFLTDAEMKELEKLEQEEKAAKKSTWRDTIKTDDDFDPDAYLAKIHKSTLEQECNASYSDYGKGKFYSNKVWGDNSPSLFAYMFFPILLLLLSALSVGLRKWIKWLFK